jgi:hypothetical protein
MSSVNYLIGKGKNRKEEQIEGDCVSGASIIQW